MWLRLHLPRNQSDSARNRRSYFGRHVERRRLLNRIAADLHPSPSGDVRCPPWNTGLGNLPPCRIPRSGVDARFLSRPFYVTIGVLLQQEPLAH
jgi:hypothetical protein